MEFQFSNWSEFMHMAGHGPYVWACYLITAIALAYLAIAPLRQRRLLFVELQRKARIEAREQQLKSKQAAESSSV
ncbi:MAG: heme exporter protein CcmD [Cellvibrionaceae bacterium]|nr:heme exporter protein CcmD [Cellvibrionaceae bacterium]